MYRGPSKYQLLGAKDKGWEKMIKVKTNQV